MDISWPWSPVEVHQSIDAPRDEVFNTLTDPRTYPDWLVGAQRIRDVDQDFPTPGSKFDHSVGPTPDVTADDETKAIAVQGHRRLVLEVHVGPVKGEVEFTLKKRGDDATEVRMRERPLGPAAVLTPALRPLLAARNMASLRNLARVVAEQASAA
jgi:uncharacterized protein YndB with AHSA1/START domain